MNAFKLSIALITTGLLATSCNREFIDLTPPSVLPISNFYRTEADIKAALTGIYGSLRPAFSEYYLFNEVPSDNTLSEPNSEVATGAFDKLTWLASTPNISSAWTNHYNTIAQCNLLMEKTDAVSFSNPATKAQYTAQAKFIRALSYFNLVRYFGDVPLVVKSITTEAEGYSYSRTPATEVFAQIEKDLTEAESVLPVSYPGTADLGRVTVGAVKSLLGKVYLQQKKYALAETKLKEVVALNVYDLLTNYAGVFSTADEFNREIIFTVQYSRVLVGIGEGSSFAVQFVPNPSGNSIITTGATPSSYNLGSLDLFNAFEPGDNRKTLIGAFTSGTTTFYYTRKFVDQPPTPTDGENNWIVIRYADVLLMLAEAQNEQGKTTDALINIQKVRNRAGLSTLLTLSQDDTRATIKQERRLELCFEGSRWPDLVRWGDYVAVMTAFKAKYNVSSMNVVPERKLYPIPFREISLNSKLMQNSGY